MYIITGHNGYIAKNFLKKTNIKKNTIIKIKRDLSKIKNIKNKKIEIINFAALYQAQSKFNDVFNLVDANLTYPTKIIQRLTENNNQIIFYNISSYFQLSENFNSKANLYSAVKNSFKQILEFYEKKKKIKYYNVYLYDVFGHGDTRPKIFNILINANKRKKKIKILHPNNYIIPTDIDDVCNVLNKYIAVKKKNKNLHINNGMKMQIKTICKIAKKNIPTIKIEYSKFKRTKFVKMYKTQKYIICKRTDLLLNKFFQEYA